MIIAGDFGINFWLNKTDQKKKEKLAALPITILAVQGNHEKRPEKNMCEYHEAWFSEIQGWVWKEDKYPNIWFAKNGEYKILDKTFLIADGAYSIDKDYRRSRGIPWFKDEQMSDADMNKLFYLTDKTKYYDFIISHTAPMNYEPTYLFLDFINQTLVDKHTEWILQEIMNKVDFGLWVFAHYHSDNWNYHFNPRLAIVYNNIYQII